MHAIHKLALLMGYERQCVKSIFNGKKVTPSNAEFGQTLDQMRQNVNSNNYKQINKWLIFITVITIRYSKLYKQRLNIKSIFSSENMILNAFM